MAGRAIKEHEKAHERQEHEEAAPQHVGDMDPVGADARVAGSGEEPTNAEEGGG